MDFLRSLHPGEGRRADAARVDPGAWRARGPRVVSGVVSTADAAHAADGDGSVQAALLDAGPPRAPHADAHASVQALDGTTAASARRDAAGPAEPAVRAAPASVARPGPIDRSAARASQTSVATASLASADPMSIHEDATAAARATPAAPAESPIAAQRDVHALELGTLRVTLPPPVGPSPLQHTAALRRHEDAAPASNSAGAADAAPIVHVTIDRIDVRLPPAAPNAAAAPRRAREPRATPLADYLRGTPPAGGPR